MLCNKFELQIIFITNLKAHELVLWSVHSKLWSLLLSVRTLACVFRPYINYTETRLRRVVLFFRMCSGAVYISNQRRISNKQTNQFDGFDKGIYLILLFQLYANLNQFKYWFLQ